MAGPGGGFSLSNVANMFRTGGGQPNDAAVQQDMARQKGPGDGGAPAVDSATGQPVKKVVPGSGGMPTDPMNPAANLEKVVTGSGLNGAKGTEGESGSPLDGFTDIFKMDGTGQAPQDPLSQKLLELDPKKFSESVGKMDFTRSINPELVQKALQGDTAAFNQVLNTAFQGAFAASMQMTVGVMEQAFNKNNGRFNSVLEGKFKNFQINSTNPTNKILNHPAAKPVLQALRQQIANSSVGQNLSPAEINQKAEDYFLAMGDALGSLKDGGKGGKGGGSNTSGDGEKEIDWSVFESGGQQQ